MSKLKKSIDSLIIASAILITVYTGNYVIGGLKTGEWSRPKIQKSMTSNSEDHMIYSLANLIPIKESPYKN